MARRDALFGADPTLRKPSAGIAICADSTGFRLHASVIGMSALAEVATLESNLTPERSQRLPGLLTFDRPEPRSDHIENLLDGWKAICHPLVVVGLAVTLDSPDPKDCMEPS